MKHGVINIVEKYDIFYKRNLEKRNLAKQHLPKYLYDFER